MIRLIHTSDLHLDSEFSCNDPKLTSLRKKEQRALFANLMMYVRDQKADVLAICSIKNSLKRKPPRWSCGNSGTHRKPKFS